VIGFTIRELTRRAEVSVTVVYSAYGDTEGLIAAAIQDFCEKLDLAHRPAARTLNRVLRDIDEAAAIILANPSYSRSVPAPYFTPTVDSRVYAIVRDIALRTFLPWLERAMAHGETIPALPIETMCVRLADDRWGVIFDWARGRIPDARLAEAMKTSFLLSAAGLAIGRTRGKLEAVLLLKGSGRLDIAVCHLPEFFLQLVGPSLLPDKIQRDLRLVVDESPDHDPRRVRGLISSPTEGREDPKRWFLAAADIEIAELRDLQELRSGRLIWPEQLVIKGRVKSAGEYRNLATTQILEP
jgi:AcrR family transcriptional regulator